MSKSRKFQAFSGALAAVALTISMTAWVRRTPPTAAPPSSRSKRSLTS